MERRPGHFCWQGSSGHRMDKPTKEPASVGEVDIEAFSHNLARMVEEGGKALAAYLKPREEGKISGDLSEDVADAVKALGRIAEYWLSDPSRALEIQTNLGRAYLDLWAGAAKRMAGEQTDPVVKPDPKDKRFADPEWSENQFFDFLKQVYLLTAQWGDRLVTPDDEKIYGLTERIVHDLAVELRTDEPGIAARNFVVERRKSRARHAYAIGGHQGRPRQSQDPSIRSVNVRDRPHPCAHTRQGRFPE